MTRLRAALPLVFLALAPFSAARAQTPAAFDHLKHQRLFPVCTVCHAGAEDPDSAMWPDSASCAACHDGAVRARVTWRRPTEERPSNLKFVHDLVPLMVRQTAQGPIALTCRDCHIAPDGPWMAVRRAQPETCLECHAPGVAHLAAADTMCATCHLSLPKSTFDAAKIAALPVPPTHREEGFVSKTGHGALAAAQHPVAVSCTVCHARDFCLTCHVDAPEQPAIQALDPDPRSRAIVASLAAPATHRAADFLARHGAAVRADAGACSTCHARESCQACHAPSQRVSAALHPRGPGRSAGAQPVRHRPESHAANFPNRHAALASTTPATCAGCHVRSDCLVCHRPDAAAGPGYHPAGFLTRHPAAAYTRETGCSDCHNVSTFCTTCHAQAGLKSNGPLGSGYHDASRFFIAGHGQAARQNLESCTACHVEKDCLTCHSALGGRRFNPHGPGFDANRMRSKNPEMCTACHGTTIPTR
jgi:doubled CXXCH motif protein